MTSDERALRLLWYAREVQREVREAFAREVWNGVVRRAQEVVEMSLKAVLAQLGGDYPKVHDVAPSVATLVTRRGIATDPARLQRIVEASRDLAAKRAPALYAEILCSREDAERALAAADDAFAFAISIIGEPPPGPFRPASR
jgi:HEPN domain-containing protein